MGMVCEVDSITGDMLIVNIISAQVKPEAVEGARINNVGRGFVLAKVLHILCFIEVQTCNHTPI